jgi:hypothetical protein
MVVRATSLGQIHAEIHLMISLKPGSQMRFHEIPILYIEEIFTMIYGRASNFFFIGSNTYLKSDECRGTQKMPRVCRETWYVVEVVKPPWEA